MTTLHLYKVIVRDDVTKRTIQSVEIHAATSEGAIKYVKKLYPDYEHLVKDYSFTSKRIK